jgi:hypothetical protein
MTLKLRRDQVDDRYPTKLYQTFWDIGNKLVLRELHTPKPDFVFFHKEAWYSYRYIITTKDFDFGQEVSEMAWNPQKETETPEERRAAFKDFALDHIEAMISSGIKKGGVDNLAKHDFALTYWNNGAWHSYYPPVETLIKHHQQKEKQKTEYLDFLSSEEFLKQRAEWDKTEMIDIPTPEPSNKQ